MGRKFILLYLSILVILLGIIAVSFVKVHNLHSDATGIVTQTPIKQIDEQGSVTVSVTWLNPNAKDNLNFTIDMSTHSVNLDQFDLSDNLEIQLDGKPVNSHFELQTQGDRHHITTTLSLSLQRMMIANPTQLKLVVKNLDNVPQRIFTWDMR